MGAGRTGTVWKAVHLGLNEYRAIKCVPKTHKDYEEFRREALVLKELKYPGIPLVYDLEEDSHYFYLIEEYLEGNSLYDLIQDQGPFQEAEAVRYGRQICSLVEYLHHSCDKPILHLDLQPKNLMIWKGTVQLIDFDHAGDSDSASLRKERYGTAGCAAPELYTTDQLLDQRTDIYAIGAILRFMLYGTLKAGAETDCGITVSGPLQNIIKKCMEPDRTKRYPSAKELELALERSVRGGRLISADNNAVSSLNIVIAGSTPGAGATHLAFGLCVYLTKMGIKVLYEERNQTGAVRRMAESTGGARIDGRGIYHIQGCLMKPWYGPAVKLDTNTEFEVVIKDFGTNWEEAGQTLKEKDHFLTAVISENLWEYGKAKMMLEKMTGSKEEHMGPMALVWRHARGKKNKDMTLGHKPFLFLEPEYISPFEPGAEGVSFLRSLWDCIQKAEKKQSMKKRRFSWFRQ